jgi:hypothetical protein
MADFGESARLLWSTSRKEGSFSQKLADYWSWIYQNNQDLGQNSFLGPDPGLYEIVCIKMKQEAEMSVTGPPFAVRSFGDEYSCAA